MQSRERRGGSVIQGEHQRVREKGQGVSRITDFRGMYADQAQATVEQSWMDSHEAIEEDSTEASSSAAQPPPVPA
jgi:hypothetical protein